jgi:hypothetical protein
MSYFSTTRQGGQDDAIDPFSDPVAFLAGLGIEAELVETTTTLSDAA